LSITYYEVSLESVVDRLKSSLERLPNLVIAVLFGSALRRRRVRDVDVAVYFSSEESLREIVDLSSRLEKELKRLLMWFRFVRFPRNSGLRSCSTVSGLL
jgi:predicted nucleotidyltransferase